MTHLRTARQFDALEALRSRLVSQSPARQRRHRSDNEGHYGAWLARNFPEEPALQTLAEEMVAHASNHSNLTMSMLSAALRLGGGWRIGESSPLSPDHSPLSADQVEWALERLFEWTGDEAFRELHPIEQTALSQARLLEILPFSRLNVPLAGALSSFWLLTAGFVFPVWEHSQPGKYLEYLDAAFRLEMQPLVDHLLLGERRALEALVGA